VLDGIQRLSADTLAALAPLLQVYILVYLLTSTEVQILTYSAAVGGYARRARAAAAGALLYQ
jgi:hypothetical protein